MQISDLFRHKVSIASIIIVIVAFVAGASIWPSVMRGSQSTVSFTSTTAAYSPAKTVLVYSTATSPVTNAKWLPATGNVISWSQASNYVGQYVTVEGTVVYTFFSSTSTTFLDFHYPFQGYFHAIIFASDLSSFSFSPSSFYLNKDVRITGTIQLYNGDPEIVVSSPSQIEVAYMGFSYP